MWYYKKDIICVLSGVSRIFESIADFGTLWTSHDQARDGLVEDSRRCVKMAHSLKPEILPAAHWFMCDLILEQLRSVIYGPD